MIDRILGNKTLNVLIGILLGILLYSLAYASGNVFTGFVGGGAYLHLIGWLENRYKESKNLSTKGSWE